MARQTEQIRDFYNRVVGYIITDTVTGDKEGRDFYQRVVGYYKKNLNQTRDFYQRVVGKGDMLSSLIMEADRKYKEAQKKR